MLPLIGGMVTGGASLLGSLMSSTTSAENTQANIAAQEQMQLQNEQFQTQMSNTAYQRATADMKAAGLNPAMMFGSGSAASTPSPGTPNMALSNKVSPFAGLGDAVGKAVSTAVQVQTFDKMVQEVANLQAEQARTAAQTKVEEAKAPLVEAETGATRELGKQRAVQTVGMTERMPENVLEGKKAEDILAMPEWLRRSFTMGSFGGRSVGDVIAPLVSSAGAVKKFLPNSFEDRWWRY